MSTKDGCETLGVTLRTLYRYIDTGDLPAYKMCRLIRLRRAEVEQFITNNKVQPGDISAGQAASNDRSWPWTPKAEREMRMRLDAFIAGYRSGAPVPCPLCGEVVTSGEVARHMVGHAALGWVVY